MRKILKTSACMICACCPRNTKISPAMRGQGNIGAEMVAFLKSILRLAAPYRGRLTLGILFGILSGLLEPIMVATVMFVYSVVFQDAASPDAQVWWKKMPGGV